MGKQARKMQRKALGTSMPDGSGEPKVTAPADPHVIAWLEGSGIRVSARNIALNDSEAVFSEETMKTLYRELRALGVDRASFQWPLTFVDDGASTST